MNVKIKRVYDPTENSDGQRILIDRLWPRGLTKQDTKIDIWIKDIAPSTELRKWFNHEPEKWPEFKKRYEVELNNNQTAVTELKQYLKNPSTLCYAAKSELYNNAIVIKSFLNNS